jgi:two-component sensor histidine kinase
LTVASATLRLQARATPSAEARATLEDALSRLGVMASTHDLLYRAATGTDEVEMTVLLHRLVGAIAQSAYCADGRIALRVALDEVVTFPPNIAIPLALTANEAVTNACKHAFPNERHGQIEVRLEHHPADDAVILTVSDNGIGLQAQANDGDSLGLKLIRAFARQIGGKLAISGEGGTTISLMVPARCGTTLDRQVETVRAASGAEAETSMPDRRQRGGP